MSKPVLNITIQQKTGVGVWTDIGYLTRVTAASFEYVTNGFYGTASFSFMQRFNTEGYAQLATKTVKRLIFWLDDIVVAVGILRKPVRSWDMIQVHTIPAIGPVDEMNSAYVNKQYVPPGGSQDLSWFYYQLAQDYILPRGFANSLQIAVIGVTRGSVTFDGTLRECITDLETLADGYMTWGLKYDQTSDSMIFFVSKRDSAASPIYSPAAAVATYDETNDRYPVVLTTIEHTGEDNDIVNKLYITGGDVPFPNLAVNPSFESIKQGGSPSSNMARNGEFDGNNAGAWNPYGGATIRTAQPWLVPVSAPNFLELDHNGEGAWELLSGFQPGQVYGLNFQQATEQNSFGTMEMVTRMKFIASDGTTVLQTETATWPVTNVSWDGRTQLSLAPAGTAKLRVEFEATVTPGIGGRGIGIDNVIVYNNNTVYQEAWRIETVATPTGTDTNADPTGLFVVDWTNTGVPSQDYGVYCIRLNAYGKAGGNYVRIINSREGNIPVNERQYYTLAVTCRATNQDGTTPAAGDNLRIGIVWGDDASPPVSHNLLVKDLHVTDVYGIVGYTFQMPAHATACRLYIEMLDPLIYYVDGVQFNQSPTIPTEFTLDTKAHFVISTHDVYTVGDIHYDSVESAPVGYGPLEEKVETPVVLTRADAIRYAKNVFDIRSLPASTESLHVVQVDTPLTIFKPDGYCQVTGIAGYTFPKLWPVRIGYSWNDNGLECDVELEREMPRSEQVLRSERASAIVKVGTGADTANTYIAPLYEEFIVGTSSGLVLSNSDRTATITLQQWNLGAYTEIFVRGFSIDITGTDPNVAVTMAGTSLIITLMAPDVFFTDDKVLVYYYTLGSVQHKLRNDHFVSGGAGVQTFTCSMVPLPGSVRVFVRDTATPPSAISLLLDISGNPSIVQVAASESLAIGDDVDILFDVDPSDLKLLLYDAHVLAGTETTYTFSPTPYYWIDNTTYAVVVWLRGQIFRPTISVSAGVASFPMPAISAGDILIIRLSAE